MSKYSDYNIIIYVGKYIVYTNIPQGSKLKNKAFLE